MELDGLVAHPLWDRRHDQHRDNAVVERGEAPLRYGWGGVWETPCVTATQVARVLTINGWGGTLRRCRRANCGAA